MHLPIVKQYAKSIKLVETINHLVDSRMDLSPGMAILAMVLDTLSGRTPLYRLAEFFEEKDTELLLGSAVEPDCFCDTNLGRAMDKIPVCRASLVFAGSRFSPLAGRPLLRGFLAFFVFSAGFSRPTAAVESRLVWPIISSAG